VTRTVKKVALLALVLGANIALLCCLASVAWASGADLVKTGPFTRNEAPDRDCPNPYDPVTGQFVGFSEYQIDMGSSQGVFFPGRLEPGATGTDGWVGPDETPVDLDGDGTPDAVFEPDHGITHPGGNPVYRCSGTGGFDLAGNGGYGNPQGDNAG